MHLINSAAYSFTTSTAILPLRLVVGAAFILHGWPKIQNPTGWMGNDASMSAAIQALVAVAEFGGGIALVLGLLTRLASLGIAAVMVGALATYHVPSGHPFVGKPGAPSCELAAVYLACALQFLLLGGGRFALDWMIFHRRSQA